MKVYITKHCLTAGIKLVEAEETTESMITVRTLGSHYPQHYHVLGKEWHRTFESAQLMAEQTLARKVLSLHKQLAKLYTMTFQEEGVEDMRGEHLSV